MPAENERIFLKKHMQRHKNIYEEALMFCCRIILGSSPMHSLVSWYKASSTNDTEGRASFTVYTQWVEPFVLLMLYLTVATVICFVQSVSPTSSIIKLNWMQLNFVIIL